MTNDEIITNYSNSKQKSLKIGICKIISNFDIRISMLKATNIHKIYTNGDKELCVLKGVDIKVDKGEFVSIFGPSGAGKSTLLHILGGLDEPTEGRVFLEGEDIYKLGDRKRAGIRNKKIGFVFQFYHLLPEFSALENVMLPAMINGARGSVLGSRAEGLLELVGLGDRIGHKPGQLSGGEQQRAAIARALINSPGLLLCDEPTGNLDSVSGKGIIELLCSLNKEKGVTIAVVTHEEAIAQRAHKVLYIRDGRLQEICHSERSEESLKRSFGLRPQDDNNRRIDRV